MISARTLRVGSVMVMLSALLVSGCGPKKSTAVKSEAPAKLEHLNEADISRIILTPETETRLQITTAVTERRSVPRTRTVAGIIAIPDGASVLVTAPVTGMLTSLDAAPPVAGQRVAAGQTVFQLNPLLPPEREVPSAAERVAMANARASLISSQITADGDVKQAEAQVTAARIVLDRARQLLKDKAGSARDVDDAQARLDIASKGLEAASARLEMLNKLTLEVDSTAVRNIPVTAPRTGILRTVSSSVGQTVSLAAPLFEVVSLGTLWVRVPVYPGLTAQIALEQPALIRPLGNETLTVPVKPVAAPPSADPLAATVDLFYELADPDGQFRPGERVEVVVPLAGETESIVVPRAAILRDIHGIAWVYARVADHTFERRRVEVHFTTQDLAVLSRGLEAESLIVVDGAPELFGTEFGGAK